MKKALTLFVAAGLAAAITVPAIGASTTGKSHGTVLTAKATPTKSGTKKKPKSVKIHTVFTSQLPAQGQQPYATKETVVHLPKGLIFNGAKFKHCSANTLNAGGPTACPASSKVGSGTAEGQATIGGPEALTVTAFNGQGSKQLLLYVQGSSPLSINSTLVGTLKKDTGKYGYKLDVLIPANLQQPLPNVYATLTKFDTTIGAKRGKIGYVTSTRCTKHTWNWAADLTFTDGTSDRATTTSKCS